jgi:hypothetical protein
MNLQLLALLALTLCVSFVQCGCSKGLLCTTDNTVDQGPVESVDSLTKEFLSRFKGPNVEINVSKYDFYKRVKRLSDINLNKFEDSVRAEITK